MVLLLCWYLCIIVVLFWYYWLTRALWCCFGIIGWQEPESNGGGLVVLLWCRGARRHKGIRTGANFGTKAGSLGNLPLCTLWYTLAYPCAHSSSTPWYRLWYTLVPTLVQPDIPWYTLWTHLYTLVLSSSLTFGRICTFLYNATLRIFLTLLILCTWRHNMLFLQ